MFLKIDLVF